jgi:hypothetical protein
LPIFKAFDPGNRDENPICRNQEKTGKWKRKIEIPGQASAEIHSARVGGACRRSDSLTLPEARQSILARRRQSAGIEHSVLFTGTRYHGALCPSSADCKVSRLHPDRVLAREDPGPLLRQLKRATFCSRDFIASQARSRMHCREGMHLLEQGYDFAPGATACCPSVGARHYDSLPNRALSVYVKPTARPPTRFKARQINYIIVIDICSLRLRCGPEKALL